jgi:hypothetical protein
MTYSVEMGAGAMIHVPGLIKIGLGTQKVIRGDTQTDIHTGRKVIS